VRVIVTYLRITADLIGNYGTESASKFKQNWS